ncbi:hypothetical protein V8C86DRAFT_3146747 [Haematococcus lacustris]
MFKLTSPTVDIRRHQLLLAPSTSGAFHRGCVHGCLTTAASSINQLDMRFVTYPAGLGIGAAMVGFAQWGVAKQIAELRGELLAANAGLAKQLADETSGIKIAMAEMKTDIAIMKRDIADISKKLDAR